GGGDAERAASASTDEHPGRGALGEVWRGARSGAACAQGRRNFARIARKKEPRPQPGLFLFAQVLGCLEQAAETADAAATREARAVAVALEQAAAPIVADANRQRVSFGVEVIEIEVVPAAVDADRHRSELILGADAVGQRVSVEASDFNVAEAEAAAEREVVGDEVRQADISAREGGVEVFSVGVGDRPI